MTMRQSAWSTCFGAVIAMVCRAPGAPGELGAADAGFEVPAAVCVAALGAAGALLSGRLG